MGIFNVFITMCVGIVLLVGAGLTYYHRTAERLADMEQHSYLHAPLKKGEGLRDPLPKWDNKNYKGLVHRP